MPKKEFEVLFNGTVNFDMKPGRVGDYIKHLESLTGPGKITLETYGKDKSSRQNRYFWGVLLPHFQQAINKVLEKKKKKERATIREAEDILRDKFFSYYKTYLNTEEPFKHFMSIKNSNWSTTEWEEKITEIRHWTFHTLKWDIPPPNEEDYN